ncbi:MAG TPA: PxKF domain-containing protein [Actinomycetota bacterium]|nr:PxKF domain-containing protein [Actinomycetota bacterium]
MTAIFMTLAGVALADQVVNNIDTTVDPALETVTITAGGAGASVGFWVQNNNTIPAGDESGCNAAPTPVTISLSVPANVTASASSVVVSGCGDENAQSVTFSSSVANASGYTIGVSGVAGGDSGGLYNVAPASFKLIVNPPPNTKPTLTLPASMTVEGNTLGGANVTYSGISASDTEDGNLTSSVVCNPASGSFFALGGPHSVNCSVTDSGGLSDSGSFNVTVVDTTPPTLTLPANQTAEATGPSGAAVSFSASASDVVAGSRPVSCNPTSGSTFPLGTTTVNCSASDGNGNSASGSFTVTVQDTTPPTLNLPANITTTATGNSQATVNYTATATDLVSGSVSVNCTPASGSSFSVGTTTVNCSAQDGAGNQASGSFTVTVSFDFNGFFRPIDNMPTINVVKAGQGIPVKFSLNGNQGLSIFGSNSPSSTKVVCDAGADLDALEETLTAGGSSLSYDASVDQYNYVWKSDKSWAGTCRRLDVKLADGSVKSANFKFMK